MKENQLGQNERMDETKEKGKCYKCGIKTDEIALWTTDFEGNCGPTIRVYRYCCFDCDHDVGGA